MGWKSLAPLFLAVGLQAAYPPDYFSAGMGGFDFYRPRYRTVELDLEYKIWTRYLPSPFMFLEFRPLVGVMATARGSGYLYGGINFDLLFGDCFLLAPGFAAGFYWQGSGKNLGFPLEFRTSVEVAWQFPDWHRLGFRFYHLSNAGLGNRNPGEESLVLYYDIPIKHGFPYQTRKN